MMAIDDHVESVERQEDLTGAGWFSLGLELRTCESGWNRACGAKMYDIARRFLEEDLLRELPGSEDYLGILSILYLCYQALLVESSLPYRLRRCTFDLSETDYTIKAMRAGLALEYFGVNID
jgi:hypothetical protein